MSANTVSYMYHKSWIADFFHSFPHLDLSFEYTNATFDPSNDNYIETLLFWAAIPLLFCAVLWLAFLLFFCIRCCRQYQSKTKEQSSTTCLRFFTGFFLLIGCGSLAVAFYGNADVHYGMNTFVGSVKSVNRTIDTSRHVIHTLFKTSEHAETQGLPALTRAVDGIINATVHTKIGALIKQIGSNLEAAKSTIVSMRGDIGKVDTEEITTTSAEAEYDRFSVTIGVNCVYILIFLLTFTALIKKSRWMFIVAATLAILFMVAVWAATSVYFFAAVGSADLCVDPDSFVLSRVNGTVKEDILKAYIKCDDKSKPFEEEILNAQTTVTQAITALNLTVNMSLPFHISDKISGPVKLIRNDLKFIFGNLSSLTTLIGTCGTIHNDYIDAVKGVCISSLRGVALLVLFMAIVGLTSGLMVFSSAMAWPHFGKRRRGRSQDYSRVDNSDPFLPDLPAYERNYGSIGQPSFGESQPQSGIMTISENRQNMHRLLAAESPPPAYHPGHYMQQYHTLAPTPTSVTQSGHTSA